jgi:hypothetical protein
MMSPITSARPGMVRTQPPNLLLLTDCLWNPISLGIAGSPALSLAE